MNRRATAGVLAIALLPLVGGSALVSPTVQANEDDEPLRLEVIVQRFVSGESVDSLIALINSRPVDFDISDEMLDELAIAGVPAELIRAMVDRQHEMEAAGAALPAPEPAVVEPAAQLTVRLNGAPVDGRETIRIIDAVHPELAKTLRLRDEDPRFTDIAIFLACLTQDHVPDHWRGQTPLGRDFVSAPRHRILTFVSGATASPARDELDRIPDELDPAKLQLLSFTLPATLEAEADPEVLHDLLLGLALETGGRWFVFVTDRLDGVLPKDMPAVDATVRDGADPLELRLERLQFTPATGS